MRHNAERNRPRFEDHGGCKALSEVATKFVSGDRSRGRTRRYVKGSHIWRAGDRAERVFLLERGQVLILVADSAGHEVLVRVIEAGQPFGEVCFCAERGGTHENSARAMADCDALELHFDSFIHALRESPDDALKDVLFTFCMRLSEAERRIDVLSYRGAEDRLARLLLQVANAKSATSSKHSGEVVLTLSHEELALMAAMSRPHVSVTMGKLRKLGLVDYGRDMPLRVKVEQMKAFIVRPKSNTEGR